MVRRKGKQKPTVEYSTDVVARNLFRSIIRDFRSVHGFVRPGIEVLLDTDISKFREVVEDFDYSSTSVVRFKMHHQIQNLLKKYRFCNDVYSDKELYDLTYRKFFCEQERISSVDVTGYIPTRVLSEARKIARQILGKYQVDEHALSCSFGSNSSIGCPLRLAHIDLKLSVKAFFTGSTSVSRWFRTVIVENDPILARILASNLGQMTWAETTLRTESLVLKDVPKTWKTLRVITPLSLLDLFYSNGLGAMITERLANHGLNISSLQQKHRRVIKQMSLDLRHTTADLSAASDSITSQLLNRVLPRDWYCALKPILKHSLKRGEQKFYTASVLPMGNGATFPVETLVFYCLIKAIGNLADVGGMYSVYGDDLIYPSRLHKYIVNIFPRLGLLLNLEKTYVHCNFRESCGSDFFRGADVRPFYLQGECRTLKPSEYVVHLYKVYNGLRRRWEECELPSTFYWLLTQLATVADGICRVPPSYPDSAGIHVNHPDEVPLGLVNLQWFPILKNFENGTRIFKFAYLRERSPERYVKYEEPYYWQSLAQHTDERISWSERKRIISRTSLDKLLVHGGRPVFSWAKIRTYKSYFRKGVMIRKTKEVKVPCVCEKNLTYVHQNTGSVTDWT